MFFEWEGFDEMDEARGSGSADLQDDGSLEIEFAYQHGDEATLKAVTKYFFQQPASLAAIFGNALTGGA